jgi:hypothetical protein
MRQVGAGAITGGNLLAQIAVAFAAVMFLAGALEALVGTTAQALGPLRAGLVSVLGSAGGLLALTLALYALAGIVGSGLPFGRLLTGLAFLNVIGGAVKVLIAAAMGALMVTGLTGALPAFAVGLGGVLQLASFVVMTVLYVNFLMGVFDLGCFLSVILGVAAAFLAGVITGLWAGLIAAVVVG